LISRSNSKENVPQLEIVTSFKTKKNLVKAFGESNNIKVHNYEELKHNPEICGKFDLGVVVSFGHLIPEEIINQFKK
jgi:methionyl-tRNA formyltransferase